MRMFAKSSFLYLALSLVTLHAQQAPPIQQLERTRREMEMLRLQGPDLRTNKEAPQFYPGENEDVGPQHILRVKPRKTHFEAFADSQYFYTDNAFLSDQTKTATALFVNTIQFAFAPEPYQLGSGQFAPALGLRSQWFNYDLDGQDDGISRLDFNAQTVFASARYGLGPWVLSGELNFTRLVDQAHSDEAYREIFPAFGLRRYFSINDDLLFIAGYQIGYHATDVRKLNIADSDVNDRLDNSLSASLVWQALPKLTVQPFYRLQYSYYPHYSDNTRPEQDRSDVINSVGLSAAYYFTKNFAIRAFINYEIQISDYSHAVEYHKLDTGVGLSAVFRF